jgi:hypothetical protein
VKDLRQFGLYCEGSPYFIKNFSRKDYIATPLAQSHEIFKGNMDEGLLAFLIQLNKDYHNGKFSL